MSIHFYNTLIYIAGTIPRRPASGACRRCEASLSIYHSAVGGMRGIVRTHTRATFEIRTEPRRLTHILGSLTNRESGSFRVGDQAELVGTGCRSGWPNRSPRT